MNHILLRVGWVARESIPPSKSLIKSDAYPASNGFGWDGWDQSQSFAGEMEKIFREWEWIDPTDATQPTQQGSSSSPTCRIAPPYHLHGRGWRRASFAGGTRQNRPTKAGEG